MLDGRTGWLVPNGSSLVPTLTNALEVLSDPARRQLVADRARSWAGRFTWDSSAERLARVLVQEMTRRDRGTPSRRQAIDLATVASWPPEDAPAVQASLRPGLRATDAFSVGEDGPRVLLTGCDEVGAAAALQRAGVPRPS